MSNIISVKTLTFSALGVTLLASVGLGILSFNQQQELLSQTDNIGALEIEKNELLSELDTASTTRVDLEQELNDIKASFGILTTDYESERERNEEFNDQIKNIGKTVGVLDKLSKTDKELLQKYSKVYFLNEHYVPEALSTIDNEFVYNEANTYRVHKNVRSYFNDMLKAAAKDGIELWVVSAYRSYSDQAALKGRYLITYGSGANAFSADQGYSEHQLGTTVDFTTRGLGGGLEGFQSTPAYSWLKDNAYKYGFTLSYSENNSYYEFEPWHWRFVGEDLARDLNKGGATFYDWEQRKIDAYLISIFD